MKVIFSCIPQCRTYFHRFGTGNILYKLESHQLSSGNAFFETARKYTFPTNCSGISFIDSFSGINSSSKFHHAP